MKFIIKGEKNEEPEVELYLEEKNGKITLYGKDERGIEQALMIFSNRIFCRIRSVNLDGIKTDDNGRIIEEE